jgi:hypothetical protein
MEIKKILKNTKSIDHKYICEVCDYKCQYIRDWNNHISRKKHTANILGNTKKKKILKNTNNICVCGKEFKTVSGLWKHKKKCNNNTLEVKGCEINNNLQTNKIVNKDELILELLHQNKELMELLKNGTNQIINNNTMNNCNNNNNNKTFNLQVFLNETCKNAMNLSEFIENMSIELTDLENMGKLGYVEGVSNIIIKNLKALEITQRPIHCSDEKRETIMIKENNVWFKEGDDRENLRKIISTVISKNLILLAEYEEKYPDCYTYNSHKSDEYNKIIMETIGLHSSEIEKKKDKVFRRIAREVVIDKSIL